MIVSEATDNQNLHVGTNGDDPIRKTETVYSELDTKWESVNITFV